MHPMLIVALIGGVLVFLAWGLLAIVRHMDRRNALVEFAAPLPIQHVNVWDRVWVRGEIECDEPRFVPHFNYPCVHFTYRLEVEERRTERTKDGGTRTVTRWVTRDRRSAAARFHVRQDDDVLLVHGEKAEWQYEQSETETLGDRRHVCTYVPAHGPVSVAGVVGEKKDTLEPLKHVPLIVTPATREQYLEQVETEESRLARLGLLILFVGVGLLVYGVLRKLQVPHPNPQARFWENLPANMQVSWWAPATAAFAAGMAAMVTLFLGSLRVYNSLVVYRTRAEMAWSSTDVLLKQRYDLIPMLVEVVQGYAAYEKKTLEELTALRGQAQAGGRAERVGAEPGLAAGVTKVLAVAEAYPELHSSELFRSLSEKTTALEDKIAHARTFFNDAVAEYNTHATQVPWNVIAWACDFEPMPLFAAEIPVGAGVPPVR